MERSSMMKYLIYLCLFAALANAETEGKDNSPATDEIPITAPSLTAVLSNPDRYLGTKVTVFGFLYGNPKTLPALFISEAHAMHADYSSSVAVENAKESSNNLFDSCAGQYVRVTGTLERVESYSISGTGKPIVIANPSMVRRSRINGENTQCWPPILAL